MTLVLRPLFAVPLSIILVAYGLVAFRATACRSLVAFIAPSRSHVADNLFGDVICHGIGVPWLRCWYAQSGPSG